MQTFASYYDRQPYASPDSPISSKRELFAAIRFAADRGQSSVTDTLLRRLSVTNTSVWTDPDASHFDDHAQAHSRA
ncbi:MAG: hypothetical protein ACLFV3_13030 [Phycisphaeraceae bacterium]